MFLFLTGEGRLSGTLRVLNSAQIIGLIALLATASALVWILDRSTKRKLLTIWIVDCIIIVMYQAIWMNATYIDRSEIVVDLFFEALVLHLPAIILATGAMLLLLRFANIRYAEKGID